MPRRPRITLPGVPLHLIRRGNNHQACFYADDGYRVYLDWFEEYAEVSDCAIHSYVLMTNHVHLLLTPKTSQSVDELMKRLEQRYVQYVNRTCVVATDLQRRLQEHNDGGAQGARYTRARRPVTLVYSEPAESRSAACRCEAAKLHKMEKEQLVSG